MLIFQQGYQDRAALLLCWHSSLWIKWKSMIHKNNNRMQVLYQRLRWLHTREFSFLKVKPVRKLISVSFLICTFFFSSTNNKDKEQRQYGYEFTGNQFSCFQDNFTTLGPPLRRWFADPNAGRCLLCFCSSFILTVRICRLEGAWPSGPWQGLGLGGLWGPLQRKPFYDAVTRFISAAVLPSLALHHAVF